MDRQERLKMFAQWASDPQVKDWAERMEIPIYDVLFWELSDCPIDTPQEFLYWNWQLDLIPFTERQRRHLRHEPGYEHEDLDPAGPDVRQRLAFAKSAGKFMQKTIAEWFEKRLGRA